MSYKLDFITQSNLEKHVRKTITNYQKSLSLVDLKKFTHNIIDPIKMLFDVYVYEKDLEIIIRQEILRQQDKTNNNIIGYFHQNIFKYFNSKNWIVNYQGFDLVNLEQKIFVEIKNKHNTMNSSSAKQIFSNMLKKIKNDPQASCFLVEIISKKSHNTPWNISIDKQKTSNPRIRKMSIDVFYKIVTNDRLAFYNLCQELPQIIEKVINKIPEFDNSDNKHHVLKQLKSMNTKSWIKFIFKPSFKTYYGRDDAED